VRSSTLNRSCKQLISSFALDCKELKVTCRYIRDLGYSAGAASYNKSFMQAIGKFICTGLQGAEGHVQITLSKALQVQETIWSTYRLKHA
jgi:hypothetical protein